jgi:hypothetical protein
MWKNIRNYYGLSLSMYNVSFDNEIVLLCRKEIKTRSPPIGDNLDVCCLVVNKRVMNEETRFFKLKHLEFAVP